MRAARTKQTEVLAIVVRHCELSWSPWIAFPRVPARARLADRAAQLLTRQVGRAWATEDITHTWWCSLRTEAAELDEVQSERLDLGQYTIECRPIQQPGEQRVSTFQLRNHVWECRQRRRAEIAVDSDRVRIWRVIHTCILRARW